MEKQLSIEELLKQYKRYIIKVAQTLTNDDYIREELIQSASIALWKAYTNFNEEKGTLHSYLINYIRNSMLNYLTTFSRTIKPSAKLVHHINRTEGEEFKKTISIHTTINEYEQTIEDIIQDEIEDNSMDDQQELVRALLTKYLSQLKERYQFILKMRYFEDKSSTEIAQIIGISKQAYHEQHNLAIQQLKEKFNLNK